MSTHAKVQKLMKEGYKPKQAVAMAISMARKEKKMADGGYVEGSDGDLDQEHERSLAELTIQGDQPPIANPEEMEAEIALAQNLHKESEKQESYAMGGLVEADDGDEKPEPVMSGGMAEPLSKEAMEAIAQKKKMRRFMK